MIRTLYVARKLDAVELVQARDPDMHVAILKKQMADELIELILDSLLVDNSLIRQVSTTDPVSGAMHIKTTISIVVNEEDE